ncbi:MAG: EAL domain-containing protein [Deltaproteobacteria bacterium]|nr:EAL domain-containing protein [Deltaproteobacteria bacterium]
MTAIKTTEDLLEERIRELREAQDLLKEESAERKRLEFEIKKLSMAIEKSANIVFITDANGVIEYVNPMFEQATGYSGKEAIGQTPWMFIPDDAVYPDHELLWKDVPSKDDWQGVLKNRKKDGEYFWCKGVISPIKDEGGRVTHFLSIYEDVTEKKTSTEKIQYLEHYDGLTGLMNRARFIGTLSDWIIEARIEGDSGAAGTLFLIDIDQFKFISDAYGHGMGDEFLRRVAKLLQVTLRYIGTRYFNETGREAFLCRLSGDEFAVFIPGISRVESVAVSEQIRKGLEGFYQADVPCHMTASIGVSMYPEHGNTASELLTRADAAMYRAKELGRNRFHFYTPEERDIEQMHSRLAWKENILKALKEDRFEAWYQPIMDMKDGRVRHYEVLARMRDKDGGIILPGPFIDIAERFGLVGSIARVIMEKAMRTQAETGRSGNPLTLCVNISGKELVDREFLYFLQSKIHETGVDPGRLVFEITETASISDLDRAIKFIRSLKALGCHVSLDDFGIGFTSFLYLKEMHVDYVKIAGPFIKNIENNLNDRLFVKAITDVARGMGIKTIAEFVENPETLNTLKELGLDYAQGYLLGRPSPKLEFHP